MSLDAQVRRALAAVHDPCSVAAGRPLSLIDMGLVREWRLADGTLHVTFAVTFAGCTLAPRFVAAAAAELAKLPGVDRVETRVDTEFAWTPELMTAPRPTMRGEPRAWRTIYKLGADFQRATGDPRGKEAI